ncbi:Type II 3-hydroxy-3-methylglutaryl-coenzyme A reductase [Rickettsiales endosymbiont of Paramecium tredecaurelia]|uniref:hydroxymethylglutaryl-CoA reductase, degradative n=1 Tax=Candidatus Sarmatiella mevalonica TaxID=2770581 RepID=UPI001924B140|nr:hydroxymethylglutaryl-CoA reductase, degradative [Candidatus Sarmatiella mevalonica]MBL3285026.1 Type II 3-hydroxy-3-methylglutaryl-coenzyme A reductase [Candidatus Sarmatiella mevalonica]
MTNQTLPRKTNRLTKIQYLQTKYNLTTEEIGYLSPFVDFDSHSRQSHTFLNNKHFSKLSQPGANAGTYEAQNFWNTEIDQGFESAATAQLGSEVEFRKKSNQNYITQHAPFEPQHAPYGHNKQDIADVLIENAIGYFAMPMGLVDGIEVNGKKYCVPICTEESSVIAALNKAALLFKRCRASIIAWTDSNLKIGQIHIPQLKDAYLFEDFFYKNKDRFIDLCNANVARSMKARGGGVVDIYFKKHDYLNSNEREQWGVVEILFDSVDAMGANIINQTCDFLKHIMQKECSEVLGIAILSNFNSKSLTHVKITVNAIDDGIAQAIHQASRFAQFNTERAVTNNKGIMNAIDGLAISTGNDFRAIEAAMHAYACVGGAYQGLSYWKREAKGVLIGHASAPIACGIVGGATRSHKTASVIIDKILDISSAQELAQLMLSVGLMQNFAALHCLVTQGITKGHIKLHVKNFLAELAVDCPLRANQLEREMLLLLDTQGYVTHTDLKKLQSKI